MGFLTWVWDGLPNILDAASVCGYLWLLHSFFYETGGMIISGFITHPFEIVENGFIVLAVLLIVGKLVEIMNSKLEQRFDSFPYMQLVLLCVMSAAIHSKSQSNDLILAQFLVYVPHVVDLTESVISWFVYYLYQVSKWYTRPSIILYMIYMVLLTIALVTAVVTCGILIQSQTRKLGNKLDMQHFLQKRVYPDKPKEWSQLLSTENSCMEIKTSTSTDPATGVTTLHDTTSHCKLPARFKESPPTYMMTLPRFQNEDVRMQCHFDVDLDHIIADSPRIIWLHNKHKTGTQERRRVIDSIQQVQGSVYRFTSVMEIYMVQRDDFGSYECWGEKRSYRSKKLTTTRSYALNGIFNVTELMHSDKTIFAPVGVFMTLRSMDYFILNKGCNVQFEHKVDDSKPGFFANRYMHMLPGCSPLTGFYSTFIYCPFFAESQCYFAPFGQTRLKADNLFQHSSVFCTHPDTVGKHTMQVKRPLMNTIFNEMEQVTYDLPFSVTLIPDSRFFYMEMENSSLTDDSFMQHLNPPASWYVVFVVVWWARYLVELGFIFFCHALLSQTLSSLWRLMIKYCVLSMKRLILQRANVLVECKISSKKRSEQTQKRHSFDYDVLVLHHDDDGKRVEKKIVIPLEKRGVKVLFPARDWAEKGNLPSYKIYAEACEKSRKILIAYSKKFQEDQGCTYNYLECMAIARVQNGELNKKDVCFVKLKPCQIPPDVSLALPRVRTLSLFHKSKKGGRDLCVKQLARWIADV